MVTEKPSMLLCNVVGSTCDRKRPSWLREWRSRTGRQEPQLWCAAAGCPKLAFDGGHVYMAGQPRDYCYIIPICRHHNSEVYDDAGPDTKWFPTRPNTAFMRIRVHKCFSQNSKA